MSTFSYKMIEKRYYNNFVFKGAKRNEIILKQNSLNNNIILFKEGTFEISFKGTINDIYDIINYYMKQYESIVKRRIDINEEIMKNVQAMNKQRKKIMRIFYNDINKEYDNKLLLINAPNIFGLPHTEKEENYIEIEKDKKVHKKIYAQSKKIYIFAA